MWIVKGKTVAGKDVEYKVPAGKDTDKAFVMALAFQEHGKSNPDDALTAETTVTWSSDNVTNLPNPIVLGQRVNYIVEMRVSKGVWERHSVRAYRNTDSAVEALESAASEFPGEKFRIVETETTTRVSIVSKNAFTLADEKPDEKPVDEKPADTPKEDAAPKKATTAKPKAA
jgi:hypothetical protein